MQVVLKKENTVFTKGFLKSFNIINDSDKKNILSKLNEIFIWNNLADIKKLKNYPLAEYRLRIWNYRILFTHDFKVNKYLFILCTHRKNLY